VRDIEANLCYTADFGQKDTDKFYITIPYIDNSIEGLYVSNKVFAFEVIQFLHLQKLNPFPSPFLVIQ